MSDENILTLHPQRKNGVWFDREKIVIPYPIRTLDFAILGEVG